ncbi:MAG TPA: protein kinase [Galbitalea sp.]|nr:protein kinase [Galbitalea sp.]
MIVDPQRTAAYEDKPTAVAPSESAVFAAPTRIVPSEHSAPTRQVPEASGQTWQRSAASGSETAQEYAPPSHMDGVPVTRLDHRLELPGPGEMPTEENPSVALAAAGVVAVPIPVPRTVVDSPRPAPFKGLPSGIQIGRYQTIELLGVGGMGAVYKAWDPAVQRHVAVKMLFPDLADHPQALERFKLEAATAGKLRHPNVVEIHDVGMANGQPYLVMELLIGESVAKLLHRRKALEVEQAVDIVLDACAGVTAMHEFDIVHRDLKPANLFLTKTQMGKLVKVVDFGLVKFLSTMGAKLTSVGMVVGTENYMAPEQTHSTGIIDGRTDQFALGVVLYECLTGRRPHPGEDRREVIENIRSENFPLPRTVRPDIPPELETVVLRALATNRGDRFPSVQAFGLALYPFASDIAQSRWSLTGASRRFDTSEQASGMGGPSSAGAASALAQTKVEASVARPTTVEPVVHSKRRRSLKTWGWVIGATVLVAGGVFGGTVIRNRKSTAAALVDPTPVSPVVHSQPSLPSPVERSAAAAPEMEKPATARTVAAPAVPLAPSTEKRPTHKSASGKHHHHSPAPAPEPVEYTPNGTPILR